MKTVEGDGESGSGGAAGAAGAAVGEEPRGYRALVGGCALAPPVPASRLVLSGEDRVRFLHGQTTCEVKELTPGEGTYGFFVSPKGRVLADAVITVAAERLVVELPAGRAQETAERLHRYLVADRVEIAAEDEPGGVLVAGPGAAEILGRVFAGFEPPAGWGRREPPERPGLEVRGELRLGVPAWLVGGAPEPLATAVAQLRGADAVEATAAAVEAVRVERGVPWAGVDFDDRHFPQETGLEQWAVSYTKGCYIGQEVVARIHYRGRVHHRLRGLRAAATAPPPVTGPLVDGAGESAGELTSTVRSPALGRPIGLAILHRRWADVGTTLTAANGTELEVVALPFAVPETGSPARDG